MVPTSALRETVVLVIFGIVLVPIAAKRAQDAPGYWQTFSTRAGQSLACKEDPPWSSQPVLAVNGSLTYGLPAAGETTKPNETIPVYASRATRAETRGPMTIRFRIARAGKELDATTTTRSLDTAEATLAPDAKSPVDDTTGLSTVAKAPAASKERSTLFWMGTAIVAVALAMSLC